MSKLALSLCLFAASAFGQYKMDAAGAPPSELAAPVRDALQKDGVKVVDARGAVASEVWLLAKAPADAANGEQNVTFPQIAHGALLGAIRFPAQGADRRGQTIKPGVYTMRYSYFPVDGAHQGVSPQRDFLILTPAADDTDPAALPKFAELMKMSVKASGTTHPAIMSIWKPDEPVSSTSLKKEGEDWVLYTKMGDRPIAIILVGMYAG